MPQKRRLPSPVLLKRASSPYSIGLSRLFCQGKEIGEKKRSMREPLLSQGVNTALDHFGGLLPACLL